jgi:3-methyladenine DNA glycosylase Tag
VEPADGKIASISVMFDARPFAPLRRTTLRRVVAMEGKPPPVKKPGNLAGYLEALSRPVFQAGMNWRVIDSKWEGIRDAFADFDPRTVADFGPKEIERLLGDPRVVRSRPKIEGTVDNAQAMIELDAQYKGFRKYLHSHGGFESTVADLKRQFRFIGDTGAYYFLYVVGEQVPPHEEWFGRRGGAGRQQRRGRPAESASRARATRRAKAPARRRKSASSNS